MWDRVAAISNRGILPIAKPACDPREERTAGVWCQAIVDGTLIPWTQRDMDNRVYSFNMIGRALLGTGWATNLHEHTGLRPPFSTRFTLDVLPIDVDETANFPPNAKQLTREALDSLNRIQRHLGLPETEFPVNGRGDPRSVLSLKTDYCYWPYRVPQSDRYLVQTADVGEREVFRKTLFAHDLRGNVIEFEALPRVIKHGTWVQVQVAPVRKAQVDSLQAGASVLELLLIELTVLD
ncbi:hypothetical protein NMY22_g20174 [Coprinellus aureogranulatus]|nr:hypothetical protein NMY22_g20174 [Coprinellus aureogranulatus]